MNLDEDTIRYGINHSHVDPQQGEKRQHHAKHVTHWDYGKIDCYRRHAIQQYDITVVPEILLKLRISASI